MNESERREGVGLDYNVYAFHGELQSSCFDAAYHCNLNSGHYDRGSYSGFSPYHLIRLMTAATHGLVHRQLGLDDPVPSYLLSDGNMDQGCDSDYGPGSLRNSYDRGRIYGRYIVQVKQVVGPEGSKTSSSENADHKQAKHGDPSEKHIGRRDSASAICPFYDAVPSFPVSPVSSPSCLSWA